MSLPICTLFLMKRQKRAFGTVSGKISARGEGAAATALTASWRAATGNGRELTHGFHAYPARMHPLQARALMAAFSPAGGVVVDPFCGSGTVLVEALAAGRRGIGTDINPIALALAHQKTRRVPGKSRRAMEESAAAIARTGGKASRDKTPIEAADKDARDWFTPTVLRELGALAHGITRVQDAERASMLRLVLSSLLVKVSRRTSETNPRRDDTQINPGQTSRMFADRAIELGAGLAALEQTAERSAREPLVVRADARALPVLPGTADLVLTSPPYAGTYDYADIQSLRASALGIELSDARARQIGARATSTTYYENALSVALRAARHALKPTGSLVVVIGDSAPARGEFVHGEELLKRLAVDAKLTWVATASQERLPLPPATGKPRREHVILLRPAGA